MPPNSSSVGCMSRSARAEDCRGAEKGLLPGRPARPIEILIILRPTDPSHATMNRMMILASRRSAGFVVVGGGVARRSLASSSSAASATIHDNNEVGDGDDNNNSGNNNSNNGGDDAGGRGGRFSIKGTFREGRASYLDTSATTPMDPRVLDKMMPYMVRRSFLSSLRSPPPAPLLFVWVYFPLIRARPPLSSYSSSLSISLSLEFDDHNHHRCSYTIIALFTTTRRSSR